MRIESVYCSIALGRVVKLRRFSHSSKFLALRAVFLLTCFGAGCSSPRAPLSPIPSASPLRAKLDTFVPPESLQGARKLWARKVEGLITDFTVARDGSAVLVGTGPDPDLGGRRYLGYRFSRRGKQSWMRELKAAIRVQNIAPDGSLAVFSTYDGNLTAIDAVGRTVWSVEATCNPIPVPAIRKIVCYHDDDSEPEFAFDVFSWKGKKLLSFPVREDVLALKFSRDQQHFALGLTKGQLLLFGLDFKPLWKAAVPGEVVDLAVSDGGGVAVLYDEAKGGISGREKLALFDAAGGLLGEASPAFHIRQLDVAPSGDAVAGYGNGEGGQYIVLFRIPAGPAGAAPTAVSEAWHRSSGRSGEYSSQLVLGDRELAAGFEDISPAARHSHLLLLGRDGRLVGNIPLLGEEGVSLYSFGFSPASEFLAVGTDDSVVTGYEVLAPSKP